MRQGVRGSGERNRPVPRAPSLLPTRSLAAALLDASRLAAQAAQVVQLGTTDAAVAGYLDLGTRGDANGKMRSTPTPFEILRTVNDSATPPFWIAITTPSKSWIRSLSPSMTRTCTRTESPARKFGVVVAELGGLHEAHEVGRHNGSDRVGARRFRRTGEGRGARRQDGTERRSTGILRPLRSRPRGRAHRGRRGRAGQGDGLGCAPSAGTRATTGWPRGRRTSDTAGTSRPRNAAGRV